MGIKRVLNVVSGDGTMPPITVYASITNDLVLKQGDDMIFIQSDLINDLISATLEVFP